MWLEMTIGFTNLEFGKISFQKSKTFSDGVPLDMIEGTKVVHGIW